MRAIIGAILLSLLPSCGKSASEGTQRTSEPPQSANEDAGNDADAGSPSPPLLLELELPPLVERSTLMLEDGTFIWGEPQPIDGAEVCVIERRDAFALYEPYEPLDPPICVTSRADEAPLLKGLPAYADYTITVHKDGYVPLATTQRLEAGSLTRVSDIMRLRFVLFTAEQASLFQPPPDAIDAPDAAGSRAEGRGLLAIQTGMYDVGLMAPGARDRLLSGAPFLPARDAELELNLEPDGEALELELPPTPLLLDAPAGLYRAKASHPRAFCEPLGNPFTYTFWGLGTDQASELEVRVLPDHMTLLEPVCYCVSATSTDAPIDGPACIFAEESGMDAGSASPDAGTDAGTSAL